MKLCYMAGHLHTTDGPKDNDPLPIVERTLSSVSFRTASINYLHKQPVQVGDIVRVVIDLKTYWALVRQVAPNPNKTNYLVAASIYEHSLRRGV